MFAMIDWKRWPWQIAGTSLLCLGAGPLLVTGCTSAGRDAVAESGPPGKARLTSRNVAAASGSPGRASLSDAAGPTSRAPATARQVAAKTRKQRPETSATDPFLNDRPSPAPTVAQTRSARVTPAAAQTQARAAEKVIAPPPRQQVASRDSNAPVIDRRAAAAERPAVTERAPAPKRPASPITQVSATRSRDIKRPAPPVIRPAVPESDATQTLTAAKPAPAASFERERADRLMDRARTMLQNGFREEALRLALVAEQIEQVQPGIYTARDERPSDFVARVRAHDSGENLLASANDHELESLLRETRAHGSRRKPRVELTEVAAGWQSADTLAAGGRREPQSRRSRIAADRTEVALVERTSAVGADVSAAGKVHLLHAASSSQPASAASAEELTAETAPGAESSETANLLADNSTADPADGEPALESDEASRLPINLTAASVAGLIAGVAGLLGLSYWRRQEQQHYARSRM